MLKWAVLGLTLLFASTPVEAKQVLYYCVTNQYDKAIDDDFKASFHASWKLFSKISKRNLEEPELVYSTNTSQIQIYLCPTGMGMAATGPSPAITWIYPSGESLMYLYYQSFGRYTSKRKVRAITHELCHFYYHLTDEYEGCAIIRHHCVMGNFERWGWTGKFCDDCWQKVERYYSNGK